jgi:hypothetical protein
VTYPVADQKLSLPTPPFQLRPDAHGDDSEEEQGFKQFHKVGYAKITFRQKQLPVCWLY